MRNVVKGFQFAQMAVPKVHAGRINASFTSFHGPKAPPMRMIRPAPKSPIRVAKPVGKNLPGRRGFKV